MNLKKQLITILLFASVMTVSVAVSAQVIDLSHSELDSKLNASANLVIIDVRSPEEFADGHVPNAVNIPHGDIVRNPALLDLYRDQEMVFYCQSGRRAKSVTDALTSSRYLGDRPLYHLEGDILGWVEANLPIEKD